MPSRSLNASPSGLPRTSTAPVPPPTEADRDGPVAVARLSGTRSSKTPSAPTPSPETRPSSTSPISGSSPATGTSSPTPLSPRGRVPALLQPHEHLLRCSYGLRCHRQPRYLRIAYDRARSTRPTPPAGTAPANGASPPRRIPRPSIRRSSRHRRDSLRILVWLQTLPLLVSFTGEARFGDLI